MKINFLLLLLLNVLTGLGQTETEAPYKRFPTLPPINILLIDSATRFTEKNIPKNQPVFIILFSPDCDHCQKETEELIDNIDKFKKIQIVMITMMPFEKMKTFYNLNRLGRFKNIKVGWDSQYILATFYRLRNFPYMAFYDKKGKLINTFEGSLPIAKAVKIFADQK